MWKITTPIVLLLLAQISASADESRKGKTRMDLDPHEKQRIEYVRQQASYCDSIIRKIANAAHLKESTDAGRVGPAQEQMKAIVGQRHLACMLTLKPNGEIADLKVESPSGSAEADAKALTLVRSAAPFQSFKANTNWSYSIDVPFLMASPIEKKAYAILY